MMKKNKTIIIFKNMKILQILLYIILNKKIRKNENLSN